MKRHQRAFTLTEILLVSTLFAVIGLTVFNAFSNGLKLWARGDRFIVEADIALFLDRLGENLRGMPTISGIPFKGIGTQVSFPTIVITPADRQGSRAAEERVDQIGAVQYSFDPAEKKIYRRQANYGQALKSQWSQPAVVAAAVQGITFQYYFVSKHGVQVKAMADEALPMGLMADVQFSVGGQERHMRRFLPIPVGGGL